MDPRLESRNRCDRFCRIFDVSAAADEIHGKSGPIGRGRQTPRNARIRHVVHRIDPDCHAAVGVCGGIEPAAGVLVQYRVDLSAFRNIHDGLL
jgi:hypothetical protein